jgi:hypothetical protein
VFLLLTGLLRDDSCL